MCHSSVKHVRIFPVGQMAHKLHRKNFLKIMEMSLEWVLDILWHL